MDTVIKSADTNSSKEALDKLVQLYDYLKSKWVFLACFSIVGFLLGFGYAKISKPEYTAQSTFVLEEGDDRGGLGAYSGLASMVGIDIGSGGGGVFQGDNILQLYKSRKMIKATLLSKGIFDHRQEILIHRLIKFSKLREKWAEKPELKNIDFSIPQNKFTLQHDSLISVFTKEINLKNLEVFKPDKKLSIIAVQFKSEDELFAKVFTENMVKNVNEFYIRTKTQKSSENLAILQKQADSVRYALNRSIGGVATAIDANPNSNPAVQVLKVPSQRKQVDVQASAAIYQEIVKNLEIAKVSVRKEKPLIQVIDEPVLPLEKKKKGKLICSIAASIVFFILCATFFCMKFAFKTLSSSSL